ncbi:MAG: hypothetical protein IJU52_08360 [Clostridia bacterium]|nr:hypothetical protein [Clostridia bacterium]
MTEKDCFAYVREMKGDGYGDDVLTLWLRELEGRIARELYAAFEDLPQEAAPASGAPLAASGPYDGIYRLWLMMKIEEQNGEFDLYNDHKRAFDELYGAFAADTVRGKTPKKIRWRYPRC